MEKAQTASIDNWERKHVVFDDDWAGLSPELTLRTKDSQIDDAHVVSYPSFLKEPYFNHHI